MNMPQRLASLNRFREKRKERCYDKKIRYTVRKEVAQRYAAPKSCFPWLQLSPIAYESVDLLCHILQRQSLLATALT